MADETIRHFSHPEHELVKRHYTGPFSCDMCWEDLSGAAYGCAADCDFAIHDTCAGHPQTLLSLAHHPHRISLVPTRRDAAYSCDVCAGDCAPGCFLYRCPPCRFDMHPRCVRLPLAVRSARHHPTHDLTLVVAEGRCAACHYGDGDGGRARAWYYRCTVCSNLDLHVSCAAGAGAGEEENNAGTEGDDAGHAGAPGADDEGELLRALIEAQGQMGLAFAMRNAGASLANLA